MRERRKRAPDEVFGQRSRRVKGAGRLAAFGANERDDRTRFGRDRGLEVQNALVHASELLDAEVRVGDSFHARLRLPRRQRDERTSSRAVVKRQGVGERRVRRREQAAVERRHAERSRMAPAVGEPRDCLERLPEAAWLQARLDRRPEGLDGVAIAIDGMPPGHQPACFGEQQKRMR